MICASCGRENPSDSLFCQGCGKRLGESSAPSSRGVAPSVDGGTLVPPTGVVQVARGGAAWHMPAPAEESVWKPAAETAKASGDRPCARCGAVNPEMMRFCKECGLRLSVDVPTPNVPVHEPQVAPAVAPASATTQAQLVAILKDGSDGQVFPLTGDQSDIGRLEGDIVLADDPYLSPRHARIRRRGESFLLRDLASINGTYIRLKDQSELVDGDFVLVGQHVMRFELLDDAELPIGPATQLGVLVFGTPESPRIARLVQYTTEGIGRDVFHLYRDETVLGRENGDIVFSDDPFMSRRHASISVDRSTKRFVLRDLGSSNGTAIRLRAERVLVHGDQFRVGRHLFRFDIRGARGAR